MEISHRIKQLLDRAGLKQKDLAKAIGATEAQISSWKNGRNDPDTDNLIKIAEYFNVSLVWLKHGSGSSPSAGDGEGAMKSSFEYGNDDQLRPAAQASNDTGAAYLSGDGATYSMERIVLARQLVENLLRILVDLHKMGLLDEEYRLKTNTLIQALTRQVMDRLEGRYPDGT
jgi:transcriptional regulator with XRE-family HTH domain